MTGGTGPTGAWAVRAIAEAGDVPILLTRGRARTGDAILGGLAGRIERFEVDIEHPLALMDAVRRAAPDVIAHLAGAKPWRMDVGFGTRPDPLAGVRRVIDATTHVLEIARSLGVPRVVFGSTKSAYAPFTGRHAAPTYAPVAEGYPSVPIDLYGITKLAAEQIGAYYREHLGVDFLALRFASTYGPGKRGAGSAPAGLIAGALAGQTVEAVYGASTYADALDEFLSNADAGRAVHLACVAQRTRDWRFNIGTGVGSSPRDVVDAIAAVEGVAPPRVRVVPDGTAGAAAGHLVPAYAGILDGSAAREQLGFTARFDLAAGIAHAAAVLGAASLERDEVGRGGT